MLPRQAYVIYWFLALPLFGASGLHSQPAESTTIGGYGNAVYQRNFNAKISMLDLERVVLFIGHRFSGRISLVSELEMEDAKVAGGEDGGEIAFEQAYLRFNIDEAHYIVAGLFLPELGILNEDHLPTSFNGNERNQVETFILPSTWRELGVGFHGSNDIIPLDYSLAIVNGLNSASFQHGSVVREGRFEGRSATANNLALTGALQFQRNNFRAQLSGYYGGSVGLAPEKADSLNLASGFFGTPVIMGEADVQYEGSGFAARVLGAVVSIPNAAEINRAYGNNTPGQAYGAYAEVSYNILYEAGEKTREEKLVAFVRYERLDMNASIPSNGIIDGTLNQHHIVTGLSYLPVSNVVLKADIRFMNTGDYNPELGTYTPPFSLPYKMSNTFFTLGIGFSF